MNKLFLKYLLEQKVSQENLAFINSIRSNSNLKPYSLHEVAAPPSQGGAVAPATGGGPSATNNQNSNRWRPSKAFIKMLQKHEDVRPQVYTIEGNRTIGVGFDLESKVNLKILREMYPNININALLNGEISLTSEQIIALMNRSIEIAYQDCLKLFQNFNNLPLTVQDVLVNMSFNMGYNRLSEFEKMIAAVNARNWEEMAREMRNSKWFRQTGDRSRELFNIIRQFAQQQQGGGTPPQQGGGGMPERQAPPPKPPATAPPATGTTPPGGGGRR